METPSNTFTPTEAAALLGVPERQLRKEFEHGLGGRGARTRVGFSTLIYLEALLRMELELAVGDRKKLLKRLRAALSEQMTPDEVQLTPVLTLHLGAVIRDLSKRVEGFMRWRGTLVTDETILDGEPVFPRTRLAVRQVGELAERGVSADEILGTYPNLGKRDVEFAGLYVKAYPRLGRPPAARRAPGQ